MTAHKALSRVWPEIEQFYLPEHSNGHKRAYRSIKGDGVVGTRAFVAELQEMYPHLERIKAVTLWSTLNQMWKQKEEKEEELALKLKIDPVDDRNRSATPTPPASLSVCEFAVPGTDFVMRVKVPYGVTPGCAFVSETPARGERIR